MKTKFVFFLFFVYLLFNQKTIIAQTFNNVTLEGRWINGKLSQAIFTEDNYAYHGSDNVLTIFDLSSISNSSIRGIGQFIAKERIDRLFIKDTTAFILMPDYGLQIINVNNPNKPTEVSSIALSQYPSNLILKDDYIYLTASNLLYVVDISNITNPILAGSFSFPVNSQLLDIQVKDSLAYIIDYSNGLRICNVQDPSAMFEIGCSPVTFVNNAKYHSVALKDNFVYILYYTGCVKNNILIFNFTNPNNPIYIRQFVADPNSSSPNFQKKLLVNGDTLCVSSSNDRFYFYNLNDPINPSYIGHLISDDHNKNFTQSYVTPNNNFLFYPKNYGFCVYDLSFSTNHSIITRYIDNGIICEMFKYNNFLYTYEGIDSPGNFKGTIRIFDVSDSRFPEYLGCIPLTQPQKKQECEIFVLNQYLYITNLSSQLHMTNSGFDIFDVSSPSDIKPVAIFNVLNGYSTDIYLQDIYAYVCLKSKGIYIVNISNPFAPVLVSQISLSDYVEALQISVSGNYAYVTDNENFLHVIDISNPSSPSIISALSLAPPPNTNGLLMGNSIRVSGSLAFIGVTSPTGIGVIIVDISDPTNPQIIGEYPMASYSYPTDISVVGNLLYCSDFFKGLHVVDISNPSCPLLGGFYFINSALTYNVVADGNYAYLSSTGKGIYILKNEYQTSIEDDKLSDDQLLIYPNPFNDKVYIRLPARFNHSQSIILRLYDAKGNEVFSSSNLNLITDNTIILNRGFLKSGIYFIEIFNELSDAIRGRIVII